MNPDQLYAALKMVEWGTESLCGACWGTAGEAEDGSPWGVNPFHAPGCPVAVALRDLEAELAIGSPTDPEEPQS